MPAEKGATKATGMTVEVKGKKLYLTLDIINPPKASSSGKTLLVATTGGNKVTSTLVNGKNLVVGVNAYIYAK